MLSSPAHGKLVAATRTEAGLSLSRSRGERPRKPAARKLKR
jgi:hypothetical protein